MKLPVNEFGFVGCRAPNGGLIRGPVATGTPNSVSIPIDCPTGTVFELLFHSHPGGVSFPSRQDMESAVRVGAKTLCIVSERDGLKCFRIESG